MSKKIKLKKKLRHGLFLSYEWYEPNLSSSTTSPHSMGNVVELLETINKNLILMLKGEVKVK